MPLLLSQCPHLVPYRSIKLQLPAQHPPVQSLVQLLSSPPWQWQRFGVIINKSTFTLLNTNPYFFVLAWFCLFGALCHDKHMETNELASFIQLDMRWCQCVKRCHKVRRVFAWWFWAGNFREMSCQRAAALCQYSGWYSLYSRSMNVQIHFITLFLRFKKNDIVLL